MLVMKLFEDQRTGPIITCDRCNRHITDASSASAVWDGAPTKPDGLYRITFLCKTCDAATPPDIKAPCWQDLNVFLAYLLNNTGMTEKLIKVTKLQLSALDELR